MASRDFRRFGAIALCLAGAPTSAQTVAASDDVVRSHWLVHAEVAARPLAKVTMADRLKPPSGLLYPATAYSIAEPPTGSGYTVALAQTYSLIGLDARYPVGCFARRAKAASREASRDSTNFTRLCLADVDADGAFDHSATIESRAKDVLQFQGALASVRPLERPIPYRTIDPKTVTGLFKVLIYPPHYASWVKEVGLTFAVVGDDDRPRQADHNSQVGSFTLGFPFFTGTRRVQFLGIPFIIHRDDGDDFKVAVTEPAEPATVFLGTSCCWKQLSPEHFRVVSPPPG